MADSHNSNRDYEAIASEYSRAILSGEISACLQVRQMCQRQVDDLKRQKNDSSFPYVFRPESGVLACSFLEELKHVKGKWAGQPFILSPWQVFFTFTLFAWVHKSTGYRRFREAFLLVPRKNGKTFWAAGIGLYGLLADKEQGSEVYCGANSKNQAMYVFATAKQMLGQDQELRDYFGAEVFASNISVHGSGSKFEPEIKRVRDGASPHIAITDELHEADDSHMVDAFSTGMGARTQPLLLIISTAGVNLAGPCFERQKALESVLSGAIKNDQLFGTVYTLDKGDSWEDASAWVKANPNYGISISPEFIEQKIFETKTHLSRRNINLCKHLNIWNSSNLAFFDMQAWGRCANPALKLDDFTGQPCWIGIDLASKVDVAAMVILFRNGNLYTAFGIYYLPSSTVNRPENAHYQEWAYDGRLVVTDGDVIDYGEIEDDLRELSGKFEVQCIAYDPFQATQLSTRMTAEGFPMVEMRPTVLNFSEPMKELEGLILQGKFVHDGDPVLTWMATNTVGKRDTKDNVYPDKEIPRNKIDGIVALIMALGRAMLEGESEESVYSARGLTVI